MSLLLPRDTAQILGKDAVLCESRSFLLDRQSPLPENRLDRNLFFERIRKLVPNPVWLDSWRQFLARDLNLTANQLVFGCLKSRLSVHLWARGSEPSGPLLDRLSGQPFIPGSAVKGCAYDMAIALLENQPNLQTKAEWFSQIALAFGWTPSTWLRLAGQSQTSLPTESEVQNRQLIQTPSPDWAKVIALAKPLIWQQVFPDETFQETAWNKRLSHFGGRACFLPAYPWESPDPDLDLEVMVTHHHQYYHQRTGYENAPDVESLRPHFYVATAPEIVFAFAIPGTFALHETARAWLRQGLATLGLGARKSSGYGWFDTSDEIQTIYRRQFQEFHRALHQVIQQEQEQERVRQQLEAGQKTAAELAEKLSGMSEEERREFDLLQLKDNQFWGKLQSFRSLSLEDQAAMIHVLQQARRPCWEALKQRAKRGGQWAQVEHAVRSFTRENDLGKMP
jgi:CRISPR type III-B/RAMP module RAMP protein Cmr6